MSLRLTFACSPAASSITGRFTWISGTMRCMSVRWTEFSSSQRRISTVQGDLSNNYGYKNYCHGFADRETKDTYPSLSELRESFVCHFKVRHRLTRSEPPQCAKLRFEGKKRTIRMPEPYQSDSTHGKRSSLRLRHQRSKPQRLGRSCKFYRHV